MLYKKKILAIVPARGGSKGIKLKNIKLINNLPLISYTLNFINKLKFVDKKIVSSDNKKILKISKKNNFLTIKRPNKLSGDRISDFKVINHILNHKSLSKYKYDYLIYLQPTSPIRKIETLTLALKKVIKKRLNGAWSVSKIDKKYHPLKLLKINKNQLRLIDQKGKKIIARQQLSDFFIRNGVFYIFLIKSLKKYKTIYMNKILPVLINHQTVNIDNKEDLKLAKKLLNKN